MFSPSHRTVVVVGAQWGDEGKGKARRRARRARRLGGALSGRRERRAHRRPRRPSFVLHQIPSGILHPGVRCAIGNGVVLDPDTLFTEIDELVADGIDVEGRLYVSDRAHLVLPYHKLRRRRELALARRSARRVAASGRRTRTRSRGAACACSICATRRGCASSSTQGAEHANAQLARFGSDKRADVEQTLDAARAARRAAAAARRGRRAHGASRDEERRGGAARGRAGLAARRRSRHVSVRDVEQHDVGRRGDRRRAFAPTAIDAVLGVVKAYTTRVGTGPLPTEMDDADGRAQCARSATSSARRPAVRAAAAGSTRSSCDTRRASTGSPTSP